MSQNTERPTQSTNDGPWIMAAYFFTLTANSTFADDIDSKPSVKGSTKIRPIEISGAPT